MLRYIVCVCQELWTELQRLLFRATLGDGSLVSSQDSHVPRDLHRLVNPLELSVGTELPRHVFATNSYTFFVTLLGT